MSVRRGFVLAFVSAALLLGGRVHAGPAVGIEGWGGWNQFNMSEVNDTLSSFNNEYRTALPPIRERASWGLGLRFWPRENMLVRVGYERLPARSRDSGVEFDVGAHALVVSATRFLPPADRGRCGVGLGLGPLLEVGSLAAPGARLSTSGWGFDGHVTGEAIVEIGRHYSVNGSVGYRVASIHRLKFGDYSSDLSAQFSGFFFRAGLAFDGHAEN